jgi:hypothetical protein
MHDVLETYAMQCNVLMHRYVSYRFPAGCSAGDSLGPVLGAVAFDRGGGLTAAYLLQTAVNALPLLMALLVVPLWVAAAKQRNTDDTSFNSNSSSDGSSSSSDFVIDSCKTESKPPPALCRCDSAFSGNVISMQLGKPGGPANQDSSTNVAAEGAAHTEQPAATHAPQCSTSIASAQCATARRWLSLLDAHDTAAAAEAAAEDTDVQPVGDVRGDRQLRHMDSALDLETGRKASSKGGSELTYDIEGGACRAQQMQQQQQQVELLSSQSDSALDLRSVLSTLSDAAVACQCLLVLLEQAATGTVVVLLPAVMGLPTWLVGVLYIAMVRTAESAWQLM